MIITQLSIFLENRPGKLAEIASLLASAGIDMRAINIAEASDYGVVRLIASESDKAAAVLQENGFILSRTPVVAVRIPDEVGGLSRLLDILAAEKIDIQYMYSIFSQIQGTAFMAFRVDDPDRLLKVLTDNGFSPGGGEDFGMLSE